MGKKLKIKGIIISALIVSILSGCGVLERTYGGNSSKISKPDFTVNTTDNLESLQSQYSEWVDKNGSVSYPYNFHSKEYEEAKSFDERTKLMQIPGEVVDSLDTAQLLDAVERYPLMDYRLYDSFDIFIKQLTKQFYGMEVLLGREDGYKAAYLKFSDRSSKEISEIDLETLEGYNEMARIHLEEYLMLTKQAFDAMTEEQREAVMSALCERQKILDEKEEELGPQQYTLEHILEENTFWLPYYETGK